uniref:Uncharacterized protein n=1 Tax=Alexandrium monilatum TaxID=311494 RepID=A0A7S4S245_9DINO
MAPGGSHNGGVFGGDEAAVLLAGLCTRESLDRAVDAGVIATAAAVLGWQGYKRPKTTGVVAAVWLLWLVCKIVEGKSAWAEFTGNASHARSATESAVREVGSMLAAWAALLLPFAVDAKRVLAPAASQAGHCLSSLWQLLAWWQRGLLALCMLALVGTVSAASTAVAAVQRHTGAVGEVLFQFSFAVCGPCLWWLTAHLPCEFSNLLVSIAISFVPTLLSVRALLQLEQEREGVDPGYEALPKTGQLFAPEWSPEESTSDKEAPSPELQQRLCAWLSYWSCWPFFHLACMMRNTELVPNQSKPAVDGLLLALAAWAQVWQASRVAPYIYMACAGCLSRFSEHAAEATSAASNSAAGLAFRMWEASSSMLLGEHGSRWAMVAAGAAAALVLASFVLHVMALANALLTLGILAGIGFDSARCAARCNSEATPSRLAFWVVSTCWLWLCSLPLGAGSLLAAWTPLVLAVAVAFGELMLKALVRVLRAAASMLLARSRGGHASEGPQAAQEAEPQGQLAADLEASPI